MTTSVHLSTEYVPVSCGKNGCNQTFAMSRAFYNETVRTGATWHCPSGHPRVWKRGKSDEQKLREAEAREVALRDQLTAAVHEAEQVRIALLRDRQRFANGVCPCCNRSFDNVRRHMASKHPDYDATKVQIAGRIRFSCSCGRSFETLRGLRTHQSHARRPGWDRPDASRWSAHLTKVGAR